MPLKIVHRATKQPKRKITQELSRLEKEKRQLFDELRQKQEESDKRRAEKEYGVTLNTETFKARHLL